MAATKFPEVTVDVDGQSYRLVIDINAMRAVEDALSTPDVEVVFHDVVRRAAKGSMRATTALFWAAMRRHHPTMTMDDVGTWLGKVDGDQLATRTAALVGGASPDAADLKEMGVPPPRPRQARAASKAGTGASLR